MQSNYWIKDEARNEVITKTQIPNKGNFEFFATYFNLMDKKGLALTLSDNSIIEKDKLFTKNGFQYIILSLNGMKELLVVPNENIEILTEKVVSKIDNCKTENDILNLIIEEM